MTIEEKRKIIRDTMKFVAEVYVEETEYDGRMEYFCFYCKAEQKKGEHHKKDCLHLLAKKVLKLG